MQLDTEASVETDPESVLNPPKGKKRWKIAFLCFCIKTCTFLLMAMISMGSSLDRDWGSANRIVIMRTYMTVKTLGVPVAALVMVWTGYRFTAIVGGLMVAVSLFVSSFLDKDAAGGIGFFVSGIAGAGISFLELSSIVPVLEYFTNKRILALVLVYAGGIIGAAILVFAIIVISAYRDGEWNSDDKDPEWRTLYRFQLIPSSIAIVCGLFIKPLDLKLTGENGDRPSILRRILRVSSWKKFQVFLLAAVSIMAFLDAYGKLLPNLATVAYAKHMTGVEIVLANSAQGLGQFVGFIVLWFLKKKTEFHFREMGLVNFIIGPLTCAVPFFEDFGCLLTYGILFGISQSVFDNILNDTIPDIFGRQHIRIIEGVIGLAIGLGETTFTYSKAKIPSLMNNPYDGYKAWFYMGGALIFLAAIFACISRAVYRDNKLQQDSNPDNQK